MRIPTSNSSVTAPIRITSGVTWLKINSKKTRPTIDSVNCDGEMELVVQERAGQDMAWSIAESCC